MMTIKMTKHVMYTRISTKDTHQTVLTQVHEITSKYPHCNLYFKDEGVSGSTTPESRDGWSRMLSLLNRGDCIYISRNDRISRSTVDTLQTFAMLAEKGIRVFSVNDETYDITTPDGKFMITLKASLAMREKELLIERSKAGTARAKSQGKICHRPLSAASVKALEMLSEGCDIDTVIAATGISKAQVYRLRKSLCTVSE